MLPQNIGGFAKPAAAAGDRPHLPVESWAKEAPADGSPATQFRCRR